jgi:hypothetical protein
MAAKKDNKTSLYLLALIGIAGYIVYNKFKKDKEMKAIQDGKREVDVFDESFILKNVGVLLSLKNFMKIKTRNLWST